MISGYAKSNRIHVPFCSKFLQFSYKKKQKNIHKIRHNLLSIACTSTLVHVCRVILYIYIYNT